MEKVNLLEKIDFDIERTDGTRKLTIKGQTKNYPVCRIPLDYLFFNDQNGRISTYISRYLDENEGLDFNNRAKYNEIIHSFIVESNEQAFDNTKKNISAFGQRVPGVVLQSGRIIDGNRRFTCLRDIRKEQGKDVYFEAVILDEEKSLTPKDIKRLELNLQHAEEKPVDYNPIDNLVDVYRDLVENKIFDIEEYMDSTNKKKNEVTILMNKAILMVEFLEFANAPKKYFIARDLGLDGPLQEINGILKKVDEDRRSDVRDSLFTAILTSENGDLTRYIREIGKNIIKTKKIDEFLEEYEDIVEQVHDTLREEEDVDYRVINEKIASNSELKKTSTKIINKKIDSNQLENVRNKPVELLNRSFESLKAIDLSELSYMNSESKKDANEFMNQIQNLIREIGENMDV